MNTKSLNGEVFYLERMALPENAQLTVVLQDVTRADAPAITVAQTVIETQGKQVPISFTLSYEASQIEVGHDYIIKANITIDHNLLFTMAHHAIKLEGKSYRRC